MSKESTSSYDSVAWGGQLEQRPADWLGDVDSHRAATDARVAQARRYFREIPFDSLKVVQTGPDRYSLFDPDGTEYRVVGYDPLQGEDPARDAAAFAIDDGGSLLFLKRRGESAIPTEERVLIWAVTEREVRP